MKIINVGICGSVNCIKTHFSITSRGHQIFTLALIIISMAWDDTWIGQTGCIVLMHMGGHELRPENNFLFVLHVTLMVCFKANFLSQDNKVLSYLYEVWSVPMIRAEHISVALPPGLPPYLLSSYCKTDIRYLQSGAISDFMMAAYLWNDNSKINSPQNPKNFLF